MKRKIVQTVALAVILVALTSSGWIYNVVSKNSQLLRSSEMATLQTTFVQQYGSKAVIKQLVSPDKVYAAMWTDGDDVSHVSWNIGGVWAVVWSSSPTIPTPTP